MVTDRVSVTNQGIVGVAFMRPAGSMNRTPTIMDLLSYYVLGLLRTVNHELRTEFPGGDLVSTEVAGKDKRAEVPSSLVNLLGHKSKCRLFIRTGCLIRGGSSVPSLLVGLETGVDSNKLV